MNEKELKAYKVRMTMRSAKMEKKYGEFLKKNSKISPEERKCIFCHRELLVKKFRYWMILKNRFPYDRLFSVSHMLAPKRHAASENDLSINEITELRKIKREKLGDYQIILENVGSRMSIKNHFHLHLLKFKK